MIDFTDDTISRYLTQQPGMRKALLYDPVQHAQVEQLRQTLATVERAMADEGVADDVQQRVINRAVWGDPEGLVDVHAKARLEREKLLSAYTPLSSVTGVWAPIRDDAAGPARPVQEASP